MTQFGNLPKRESLLEAVTPVGTYGGVGHFVEYFGVENMNPLQVLPLKCVALAEQDSRMKAVW